MKDKIMYLIIGMLIGAIITTVGFFIYYKQIAKNSNPPAKTQMDEMNQMQPPSNGNMGEPPEKPDGDYGEEPPAKPDNSNNEENS